MYRKLAVAFFAAVMGANGVATAATFVSFVATDGSAQVDITATPNGPDTDLTIVLTNKTSAANSLSAGNLLTGVKLDPQDIEDYTLTGQSAAEDFVFNSDTTGTIVVPSTGPNWVIDNSKKALYFNGFGTGGQPIIGGPAIGGTSYPNGNSSLSTNQHGVYVYRTATFFLQAPGTVDATTIEGVTFLFNTNGNEKVDGVLNPNGGGGIPEPATLGVLGLGALGLMGRRRRV